jgi:hypothetical protein
VSDPTDAFAPGPLLTFSRREAPIAQSTDKLRPGPIDLDKFRFHDSVFDAYLGPEPAAPVASVAGVSQAPAARAPVGPVAQAATVPPAAVPPAAAALGGPASPPDLLEDRIRTAYAEAARSEVKRDRLLYVLMDHSDRICDRYTADMLATRSFGGFLFSSLSTGLSTAATVLTGLAGQALSAGAAASNATRSSLAEEVFQKTVVSDLTRTIKETRAKYRNSINEKLRGEKLTNGTRPRPTMAEYSVDEAIGDALLYHNSCSFTAAMDNLAKGAAQAPAPADASGKTVDVTGARVSAMPPTPQPVAPTPSTTTRGSEPPTPTTSVAVTPPPVVAVRGALPPRETLLTAGEVRRIQAALCVTADANFGDDTRGAIRQFRLARNPLATDLDRPLSEAEILDLKAARACASPYRTAYERFRYFTSASIVTLQKGLNARTDIATKVPEDGNLASARGAIRFLNNLCKQGDSELVTPGLLAALAKAQDKTKGCD